jgi:hypothetical protein
MQILLTGSGTPYIEVDEKTKLIFSKSTADREKGYKFLVVSSKKVSSVCISGAKAKKKRYMENVEDNSFTVRLKDFKRNDDLGFTKGVVSPITLNAIKKLIVDKVDDEGFFSYDHIETLNDELAMTFNDPDENVDDDPTADESFDSVETVRTPKKKVGKITLKSKPKIKITSPIQIKKK